MEAAMSCLDDAAELLLTAKKCVTLHEGLDRRILAFSGSVDRSINMARKVLRECHRVPENLVQPIEKPLPKQQEVSESVPIMHPLAIHRAKVQILWALRSKKFTRHQLSEIIGLGYAMTSGLVRWFPNHIRYFRETHPGIKRYTAPLTLRFHVGQPAHHDLRFLLAAAVIREELLNGANRADHAWEAR